MDNKNFIEKAKNLTTSIIKWATEDGFSKVTNEQFFYRKEICEKCDHWNKEGFSGLGQCKLCGCSVAKLYIPSSTCPDSPPRWTSVSASYNAGSAP